MLTAGLKHHEFSSLIAPVGGTLIIEQGYGVTDLIEVTARTSERIEYQSLLTYDKYDQLKGIRSIDKKGEFDEYYPHTVKKCTISEFVHDRMALSRCIVCNIPFKKGDTLQAFIGCPEDINGSWTKSVIVDEDYQKRSSLNQDKIKRKHATCMSHIKGKFDGCASPYGEIMKRTTHAFINQL